MLPYHIAVILGYSIIIPAFVGLIRYRAIDSAYQPFIIFCVLDVFNHTLSAVLIRYFNSNTVNGNVFILIEAILFILLFKNWGLFKKKRIVFYLVVFMVVVAWIVDNLIVHKLTTVNSFYRIIYSFVLVFLSIEQMNVLISTVRKNLLLNSSFIICCGLITYYSYKATVEVFFFIQLKASVDFYTNIFVILVFVNCVLNLIFGWATLWIPRKPRFILPR